MAETGPANPPFWGRPAQNLIDQALGKGTLPTPHAPAKAACLAASRDPHSP